MDSAREPNQKSAENRDTWSAIPPRMKRTATAACTLPDSLLSNLLPSPGLSIKALTEFLLPSQLPKVTAAPPILSHFFSKEPPSIVSERLVMHLRQLPTPDPATIQALVEFSLQAWLDGFTSVRYHHIQPGSSVIDPEAIVFFPLWAIAFWSEVLKTKKISTQWIKSRDWIAVQLKQKKSVERRQLAEQASIILTVLPWGKFKPSGFFSGSEPIHALWRYLGSNWLSDSEQNEMLELIRGKCLDCPQKCAQYRIESTYFTAALLQAFDAGSDLYQQNPSFAWLRHLGKDIVQERSTVITVVHLEALTSTPHWVPLAISRSKVNFGDSFGTGIPQRLQAACFWWLRQHHVGLAEITDPTIHPLPITTQIDGHSCGILADNALDNFVNGTQSPLLRATNSDMIAQRLQKFNTVAQHIIARLESMQTFGEWDEISIEATSSITAPASKLPQQSESTSIQSSAVKFGAHIPTSTLPSSPVRMLSEPPLPNAMQDTHFHFTAEDIITTNDSDIDTDFSESFGSFSEPPAFSSDWSHYERNSNSDRGISQEPEPAHRGIEDGTVLS